MGAGSPTVVTYIHRLSSPIRGLYTRYLDPAEPIGLGSVGARGGGGACSSGEGGGLVDGGLAMLSMGVPISLPEMKYSAHARPNHIISDGCWP